MLCVFQPKILDSKIKSNRFHCMQFGAFIQIFLKPETKSETAYLTWNPNLTESETQRNLFQDCKIFAFFDSV